MRLPISATSARFEARHRNRTDLTGFADRRLMPLGQTCWKSEEQIWNERGDLNSQPRAWHARALPFELRSLNAIKNLKFEIGDLLSPAMQVEGLEPSIDSV